MSSYAKILAELNKIKGLDKALNDLYTKLMVVSVHEIDLTVRH